MKKMMAIIAMLSGLLFFACGKDKLKQLEYYARQFLVDAEVNFCTLPPDNRKSTLKFIFVMDKSSSNQTTPTDDSGVRRYQKLIEFIDQAPEDNQVFYGLINFASGTEIVEEDYTDPITGDNVSDAFFLPKDEFEMVLDDELDRTVPLAGTCDRGPLGLPAYCSTDYGNTNYIAALIRVRNMITNDITNTKDNNVGDIETTHYVVTFITDGAPNPDGTGDVDLDVAENVNDRVSLVTGIMDIMTNDLYKNWVDSIVFNTVYYDGAIIDTDAINLLSEMASEGDGMFYQASGGVNIDYNTFSVPVRSVKHSVKDIFIFNSNVAWDEVKGMVAADSDGDGIRDDVEDLLGSDRYKKDSDENGISDKVEYTVNSPRLDGRRKPCLDVNCSPSGAATYDTCIGFVNPDWPMLTENKYVDTDKDGLNNCEEIILGSAIDDFDSNDDWIPDDLAFRFEGISYIAGPGDSGRLLDSDGDNVTNYMELKMNTPGNVNNDTIINLKLPEYNMTIVSDDRIQTCYKINMTNIPAVGEENMLKIYIMEKSAIIDDSRFLRTATKRVSIGSQSIIMNDSDFD